MRATTVGLGLLLLAGCEGVIEGPLQPGVAPGAPGSGGAGGGTTVACVVTAGPATAARVRRLTRAELDATFSQLLAQPLTPSTSFPIDTSSGGYTNQADHLQVTQEFADKLNVAAETMATLAVTNLASLLPCTSTGDEVCARAFINDFVKKAYRREVTAEERAGLFAVYQAGRAGADFKAGIGLMLQVVFQSPNFLFRTELGAAAVAGAAPTQLTLDEIAAELAYLVTGAPPDATLSAAADLTSPDGREREVLRLMKTPQARRQVSAFFSQWLGIDRLEKLDKDTTVFPLFSPALASSMRRETSAFVEDVVFASDGTLRTLFTANYSFIDASLAKVYAVAAPASFGKVTLDGTQRAGLLTHASVLATWAQRDLSSPVQRGKQVRTRIFCQPIAPPPPGVSLVLPSTNPTAATTTRARFEQHTSSGSCVGCHKFMDPIGFGFENYDGIGQHRITENGVAVDASGELTFTDSNGPFTGAVALGQKLGNSAEVRACFTRNWFQFALARSNTNAEHCNIAATFERFQKGEAGVRDVVVAVVRSEEFTHRLAQRN